MIGNAPMQSKEILMRVSTQENVQMKRRMNQFVPFVLAIGAVLTLGAACRTSGSSTPLRAETPVAADAGAAGQTGAINLAIAMPVIEHAAGRDAGGVADR
jgi:hypothetical protein